MKFRKKPIDVEAFQMTRERRWDNIDWPNWLHNAWLVPSTLRGSVCPTSLVSSTKPSDDDDNLIINAIGGMQRVGWNDWIIKVVEGELYCCKPNIFEATYEPVIEQYEPAQTDDAARESLFCTLRTIHRYQAMSFGEQETFDKGLEVGWDAAKEHFTKENRDGK